MLVGTTNIGNSMAIIPITMGMHISKTMAIAIIMAAIAVDIAIVN